MSGGRRRAESNHARRLVLGALTLAAVAGAAVVASRQADVAPSPPLAASERPRLMLLTSLPIVFAESFGLEGGGSPALTALEKHYQVEPISVADAATLGGGGLLLMAQPLAQPAEALVELDRWVRSGGRVLLLADPLLEWPSERPLGDVLRPSTSFADTGLLRRWGLGLYLPDERGPKQQSIGPIDVMTVSPGTLEGKCAVERGGLVARCAVGRGTVTVVADADFLNVEDLDGPADRNLEALVAELKKMMGDSRAAIRSTDLSTGSPGQNKSRTVA